MRLLVYTPTCGEGLRPECRAAVEGQQTGHAWTWVIDADDPFPAPDHRNVLAKYRRARTMALDGGYDALVTVEHDNVPPVDALELLAGTVEHDGQPVGVVYAPYVLRRSCALSAWQYVGNHALGMPLTLYPEELGRYRQAGVGRVSGCGWGCTLIRRSVLERVPLHDGNGTNAPGDIVFATDCVRAGVVAVGRFDCPVGHHDGERVLMPERDAPILLRVEALVDVTVTVEGARLQLRKGMRYSVSRRSAARLAQAGYVWVRRTEPE
jgi:hypothetical protein